MKKTFLLFTLLITLSNYSQEKFEYTKEGLFPKYLVTKIDSLNANQLYIKSINWIKETYKNPDKVIKAKFEGEKIRFEGASNNYLKTKILGMTNFFDIRYTIEISVKNMRYKFEPISLEYYVTSSKYTSAGWVSVLLDNGQAYYKKKGKLKRVFRFFPKNIGNLFNDLEDDLNLYLLKENKTLIDKKDDR